MASLDNLYVMVSLVMLAFVFIIGSLVWDNVSNQTDVFDVNEHTLTAKNNTQGFFNSLDITFTIFYFAYHIGILVLAFFLRSHPIIYIASILIIGVLALLAAPLSNTYQDFIVDENVASTANGFVGMNWIIENLPFLEIVWGFISAIVLAGLARSEGFI